jgi:hypothetical protein
MTGERGHVTEPRLFGAGDEILYRGIDEHRRLVSVLPVRVVQDNGELVVLWLPLGTSTIKSELVNTSQGLPRRWDTSSWRLTNSKWSWAELLILVRPGERSATWVRWSAEREFEGWYVNLQSELLRTRLGFDILDHQLDIIVDPARRWRWKDEDELELAVALGRMSREQARAVREEGIRTVTRIESNDPPFSDGWERWAPDPAWPPPQLVSDWDDVSMYRGSE